MKVQQNLSDVCFQNGYRILENKGTALVGMSLGNSYFKRDVIQELLEASGALFSQIIIIVPDKPMLHTYRALGYSNNNAQRKMREEGNRLRNRCKEGLEEIKKKSSIDHFKLLDWHNDIETHQDYKEEKKRIYDLYDSNQKFKNDVRTFARDVIHSQLKQGIELESAIDQAVNYVLEELAFMMASARMLKAETAVIYHRPWGILEKYIAGFYDGIQKEIGYVIFSRETA